jgi:hypothetical protein
MPDKPQKIKIDDVEYVRTDAAMPEVSGEYVIVRCRNAGVHAGYLQSRTETVLRLKNSRRLWQWWSKFTLSELAIDGPLESKLSEQKYARVIPELELTSSDVAEVIQCTDRARIAIEAVKAVENV